MAFNPDEYLNEKPAAASGGFDPDAYLGASAAPAGKTKEREEKGALEAAAMGFAKGANFGFQDEIEGALGGAKRGIKNLFTDTGDKGLLDAISRGYKTDRDASREYSKQLESDQPLASIGGGLASALPSLGAKGAISIGNMVGQGAIQGFGNSEEEDLAGMAKDTAIGGGISGALGGAAAGVSKGIGAAGTALNDFKVSQALKALGAQKSQMKRLGGEYGDDVAQFAIDKGLINPLKSVDEKQALAKILQQNTGDDISKVRDSLPSFDKTSVLDTIKGKMDFNPDLGVNAARKSQLDTVAADLDKMATEGKINAKDLLDYKSALFDLARKSNGEVNPVKDVLENARQGIGTAEKAAAGSAEYSGMLNDYSKIKNIQNLLDNKASQSGNSLIGAGGMAGGIAGSVVGGAPGGMLGALVANPAMRSKAGELGALAVDKGQKALNLPMIKKLVESGKLDPKIAAYLLSRQQD